MVESAVFVAPCSVSCFAVFWANEKMPTKNSHHCCDRSFSDSDDGIQNSAGNLPVLRFKSSENSQNVAKKKKNANKNGMVFFTNHDYMVQVGQLGTSCSCMWKVFGNDVLEFITHHVFKHSGEPGNVQHSSRWGKMRKVKWEKMVVILTQINVLFFCDVYLDYNTTCLNTALAG